MADNELFGISEQLDDTISRRDTLDALTEQADEMSRWCERYQEQRKGVLTARNIIKDLPSAHQWIPCSERLPEDYTDVLVWFEYYRYGDYNRLYQMHGIGNYMSEYDSWLINYETGWRKLRVLAWCPLPEPWKEEQE